MSVRPSIVMLFLRRDLSSLLFSQPNQWLTSPPSREHPDPQSTPMYRFMQDLNRKHGLQLQVGPYLTLPYLT